MILVCTALGAPDEAELYASTFAAHWPPAIELVTAVRNGPGLIRWQISMPAAHVSDLADGDIIAWLDPDVVTFCSVPSYVIPNLLKSADVCYISAPSPVEFGFWAARLTPDVRSFLAELAARTARGDDVTETWWEQLSVWSLAARDLMAGRAGPWSLSPLGRYTRRGPSAA